MLKHWIAAIAGLGLSTMAMAAPVAGEDYQVLDEPVETRVDQGQIEVTEVFWYGCPHCYTLNPMVTEWSKTLPEDVVFRPVPAMFGGAWNTHGQLFYTLDSLGKLEETHDAVFNAIHKQNNRLADEDAMIDFLEAYGISEDEFRKAWSSFGVKSRIDQATRLARSYRATGVPCLIINGKYRIEGQMAGSYENMLKIAEYLIEQERQATQG